VQHHVIEGVALADGFAVTAHFGLQQKTVFNQVMAIKHFGHFDFQLIGADIGQKAQAATVDTQHRNIVPGQGAGGAQQTAISADHNHHVADFAEHFA